MGWLALLTVVLRFGMKLLDFLDSKEKTLEEKVRDKNKDLSEKKADFKEGLKKGNYEKISHQLRDALDDIDRLRRKKSSSDK